MSDFNADLPWQAYRLVLRYGLSDPKPIYTELGISESQFTELQKTEPSFQKAIAAAEADRLPAVFADLSDESKQLWATLVDREAVPDAKQAALLAVSEGGKREQQKLLIYGLVESHFDVNSALKALKIPLKTFRNWIADDPEFAEMISEVQDQKKAFIEGRLFKLIAMGSERATIFGAERLLKEYSAKVEHTGQIAHNHQHNTGLDLSKLPVGVRSQIFEILTQSNLIDQDGLLAQTPTALDAVEVKRLT
jgi:hypothetical protein